jgi:deoxyribose-phosphate aldolase
VFDEIAEVKEACGPAHLKVILETGELGSYDQVRKASMIAMYAGSRLHQDFDGKDPGRRHPAGDAGDVRGDSRLSSSHRHSWIGMKPAGGISNAKLALAYLVMLYETLGAEWMTPDLFRIGASSLLNDILMQLRKEATGAYQSADYFTLD